MSSSALSDDPDRTPAAPTDLWEPLRSIVGAPHVLTGSDAEGCRVEGTVPRAVVIPGSTEELSRVMALAHRHRLITVPRGSGSQMHWGTPPGRVDLVVALHRLDRLIEYEPADMTVAVEAGMPLSKLQGILGEKGQFLPVDPPTSPSATLGGLLSTRAAGPLRAGFGTLRDRLLGVRAVLPDGRIAKAGGRVVKNVAGYDLGRLYMGALGTLAIVTEIYLKVQPLPAAWGALSIAMEDAAAVERGMAALMASEVEMAALEVVEPGMAGQLGWDPHWHVAVGFAGTAPEVAYLQARSRALLEPHGLGPGREMDWPALHGRLLAAHRGTWGSAQAPTTARVHLLSSQVSEFLAEAAATPWERGARVYGIAHGFNGIVRLHLVSVAPEEQIPRLLQWRRSAEALGGSLVLERAPAEVKAQVGVWGNAGEDLTLMQGIKGAFDPRGILNPGRFFGGI